MTGTEHATALATVRDLLAKYGIEDPDQAHRLIRERFTTSDLDAYRQALDVLDGSGALG